MTASDHYQRSRPFVLAAALAMAFAAPALALDPVPSGFEGRDVTYDVIPGSLLRSGDSLLSSVQATIKAGDVVKGTGVCTTFVCPVVFNGQSLYARRSRLRLLPGTKVVIATPPPGSGGIVQKIESVFSGQVKQTLRRGDEGADVRRLQEALNKNGANLTVDSNYGRGTLAAVENFQKTKGLNSDGTAGPLTLRALGL